MTRPWRALALVATCGALAATAGCGGSEDGPEAASASAATTIADSGGAAARSADAIEIADFKFDPETIRVEAGTEVTWTNSDDAPHTATADDGAFDTGNLAKGESKSVELDHPGSLSYYCRFHPFMKATVEVQ
ncbi:MAG: cupredoxin family copper-binding protein [Solirubrobacterales bacterium]